MSRNVYGRRQVRPTALQTAIELSPTTFNAGDDPEDTSRSSTRDDFEAMELPVSPCHKKRDEKDASEASLSNKRRITSPKSPSPKLIKSRKSLKPEPLLNSFFVESKSKPTWSPTKTPPTKTTSSPLSDRTSPLNPQTNGRISTLTQKLQNLSDEPHSPMATTSTSWDFLDDLNDDPVVKPTTIVKKVSLRSPRKEKEPEDRRALLRFFESQEFKDKNDKETSSEPQSPSIPQLPQSPRLGTLQRGTYGAKRSYLVERSNDETTADAYDQVSTDEDIAGDNEDNLKSITNLRAQGESAKFLDDFNFVIEGIESKPSLLSFLELAMKLFEDDFLRFVKSRGIPNLQPMVDQEDVASVFALGFILCKVPNQRNGELDPLMIQMVRTLLTAPSKLTLKKESKTTKELFKEFTDKLGPGYTPQFVAVTLLLQGGLFLSDDLTPSLIGVLSSLDLQVETDLKLYHMTLILLESYLSKKDKASSEFGEVYKFICENTITNPQTDLLQLKLIIVLSVKKFNKVFDPTLFLKALKATITTDSNELQLLNIGLLISLVEDPKCLKVAMRQENLKKLHTLYSKASDDCIPYFSLLVGTLYAESQLKIRKEFHTAELDRIVLELQRFDKFDRLMSLQVQHILAQFST